MLKTPQDEKLQTRQDAVSAYFHFIGCPTLNHEVLHMFCSKSSVLIYLFFSVSDQSKLFSVQRVNHLYINLF